MADLYGRYRIVPPRDDREPEAQPIRFAWRRWLLQAGFLAMLALFGVLLWLLVDLGFYSSQAARISHVGRYCFIERSGRRSLIFREDLPAPTKDCDGLRRLFARNYSSSRYRLVSDIFITFTYVSPADGQPHPGMIRRSSNDFGQPAKPGDTIVIHASRLFGDTYTDWRSANAPE